jgi:hypothetical protein
MASFNLLSSTGQVVASEKFNNSRFNVNVQLPEAAAGMYYIEVVFQDGTRSVKKLLAK